MSCLVIGRKEDLKELQQVTAREFANADIPLSKEILTWTTEGWSVEEATSP